MSARDGGEVIDRLVREGIVYPEEATLWRLGVNDYYDARDPARFTPDRVLKPEEESEWRLGGRKFKLWVTSIGPQQSPPYERRFRLDLVEAVIRWPGAFVEAQHLHVRLVGNMVESIADTVARSWGAEVPTTYRSNEPRWARGDCELVSAGMLEKAVRDSGKSWGDAYL